MRLGIDFGTTRTVVATADRGNYPVVSLIDDQGDPHEFFPSAAALVGDDLVFGFAALAAGRDGAPLLRSFKRVLGEPATTVTSTVELGDRTIGVIDLLTSFLAALRAAVHTAVQEPTGGPAGPEADAEPDLAVVSVPAHAHTAQRYLTIEAFRRAGFEVLALVNEPSAAGFEYTHRQPRTLSARRTQVLVYDLGGGTFDASLVRADGVAHEVVASVGVNRLGGDDVDAVLAAAVLDRAGRTRADLDDQRWDQLLDDCREAKERLTPQSRRVLVELDDTPVMVAVEDFYAAARPLIEQSVRAMEPLIGPPDDASTGGTGTGGTPADVAGIYLVGGGSGLPLVPRVLRERFGRRVHRSPYPAAATAIGLAIAADPDSGFTLVDRLSRGFGVFRERSGGATLGFDEVFSPTDVVPGSGTVTITRRYRAAHNIGWFRHVEYTSLGEDGEPLGEIVPFAEVLFPFDPDLRDVPDLSAERVRRWTDGPVVSETYTIDADGMVEVAITDETDGYTRRFGLR